MKKLFSSIGLSLLLIAAPLFGIYTEEIERQKIEDEHRGELVLVSTVPPESDTDEGKAGHIVWESMFDIEDGKGGHITSAIYLENGVPRALSEEEARELLDLPKLEDAENEQVLP